MGTGFATVTEEEGVSVTSAEVNGFTLSELRFPESYLQAPFEPELPYLAVVLEGALVKSFPRRALELERPTRWRSRWARRMARASARRRPDPDREAAQPFRPLAALLRSRCRAARARADLARLAPSQANCALRRRRAACRRGLRARAARGDHARGSDRALARPAAGCGFARRGAAAGAARRSDRARGAGRGRRSPSDVPCPSLPRPLRASVGEYGRRLRPAWAAAELARGGKPLAEIAASASFADQSHFTRVFRRQVGTTPARYREQAAVPARSKTGSGRSRQLRGPSED